MNYKNLLLDIQKNNTLGPSNGTLPYLEDALYEVDLNTRIIKGPEFLSVQDEHRAEIVYFELDRFYCSMDLTQTNCIIQYQTSDKKTYYYPVPFCDVVTKPGKMIIPWSISSAATASTGAISYVIRFYLLNDDTLSYNEDGTIDWSKLDFSYSLSTLPATSQILKSFALENALKEEDYHIDTDQKFFELVSLFAEMTDNATLYWIDV